jgi:NAD(P)H dehydrogenase (quinone)
VSTAPDAWFMPVASSKRAFETDTLTADVKAEIERPL